MPKTSQPDTASRTMGNRRFNMTLRPSARRFQRCRIHGDPPVAAEQERAPCAQSHTPQHSARDYLRVVLAAAEHAVGVPVRVAGDGSAYRYTNQQPESTTENAELAALAPLDPADIAQGYDTRCGISGKHER